MENKDSHDMANKGSHDIENMNYGKQRFPWHGKYELWKVKALMTWKIWIMESRGSHDMENMNYGKQRFPWHGKYELWKVYEMGINESSANLSILHSFLPLLCCCVWNYAIKSNLQ